MSDAREAAEAMREAAAREGWSAMLNLGYGADDADAIFDAIHALPIADEAPPAMRGQDEIRAEIERLREAMSLDAFETGKTAKVALISETRISALEWALSPTHVTSPPDPMPDPRDAALAKAREALEQIASTELWQRCPSTHCERRQECTTPYECSGTGCGIARLALSAIDAAMEAK